MQPFLLFVLGGAIALYCLWQLRLWQDSLGDLDLKPAEAESRAGSTAPTGRPDASPPLRSREAPAVSGSPSRLPAVQQEAYRLADAGMAVGEIARRLSLSKGEVQLILSLRRPR